MDDRVPANSQNSIPVALFESLKKTNDFGAEYWSARDLQPHLGYSQWRNFKKAIDKAITSCDLSGNDPNYHFAEVSKAIVGGKGASQSVPDYCLSRFACFLIAQNGQPSKPEIANAQKYFAIQTRRQELSDQAAADRDRLELRQQTSEGFKALSGAARQAGVQNSMFGIFHDAGYKGMYGGLSRDDIKRKKRIPDKDNLMDRMGTTELAANNFRMTQAKDKLARSGGGQENAIRIHAEVGREVRRAIEKIGGTLPEDIPAAEHIKEVKKRAKAATPRLELEKKDALGLAGDSKAKIESDDFSDV